jgi:hypothetical protein
VAPADAYASAIARAILVQKVAREDDMSTTIDDTMIGLTLFRNGVMSKLTFTSSGRGVGGASFNEALCLIDDAAVDATGINAVPRQLFNSDLLTQPAGSDGRGVCLQNQSIAFGNLTVRSVPSSAVFSIDATGAVTATDLEARRAELKRKRALPAAQPYVPAKTSLELTPHAEPAVPPAPPDLELIAALETARRQVAAERAAQQAATAPTTYGRTQMEIENELVFAIQQQRAASAAADADAEVFYRQRDAAQRAPT